MKQVESGGSDVMVSEVEKREPIKKGVGWRQ